VACSGSVGDPDHLGKVVKLCLDQFGRLDVVVNNAARVFSGSLIQTSWGDAQETFATNVLGPITLVREAWNAWMKSYGGSVVNVSSLGAVRPRAPVDVYGASKASLEDITRRLALELAPTVRVNAVAPGVVLTAGMENVPDREAQVAPTGWPLGRVGAVDDIASAVLYLASDAASWITGQVLRVDGGRSVVVS
jgi:3-oxoacyl-[acyl-carrier protein] reductase